MKRPATRTFWPFQSSSVLKGFVRECRIAASVVWMLMILMPLNSVSSRCFWANSIVAWL